MSKKNEAFDLGSIDTVAACNKGFEVELKHPATKEPLGIFWSVLGSDSDTVREYTKEKINTNLRKEAAARKKGGEPDVRTVQDFERDSVEFLTICSVGWRTGESNTIKFRGEDLEFNVPNAKKVLTDMPWIRKQLDEAINDLENFMKS